MIAGRAYSRSRALGASFAIVVAAIVFSAPLWAQPSAGAPRVLDDFSHPDAWRASASDGVRASVQPTSGPHGAALRLDFDLAGTAGYALAARTLAIDLPDNYEISFDLRADAPVNTFQFKLVDASGENVWWFNQSDFAWPREWTRITIKKRQIGFAWGPTRERELRHAARLEIVVAAGRDGGAGSISIGRLELRERPPAPATWPAPAVQASSSLAATPAALAVDGNAATAWTSDPARGREQWIALDFGRAREFGGLVLRWREGAYASRYDVAFSDDGTTWTTMRRVADARGGPDAMLLPESETRYVRLALHDGPAQAYALAEIEVRDLAFGASPNAFFEAIAREAPRGTYPRGFSGQQSYWTVVGIDGGSDSGLLSEDGALEVAKGGFSIEPFVRDGTALVTWADVSAEQALQDRYLPIPSVGWRRPGWTLRVTSFAAGTRAQSRLYARYDVRNETERALQLELVLAIRPSQVNPPAQFLNAPGGVSPIRDIAWDGRAVTINGRRAVFALQPPARVGAFTFDNGPLPQIVARDRWDGHDRVADAFGYASAALAYPLALAPHGSATIALAMPLSGTPTPPAVAARDARGWIDREQQRVAAQWREKLDRVAIRIPSQAQPLADTLRTALAHLLILRDGPILRPGARAYARSWIRDGAMIGESLLRLDRAEVAADYLRWFAPHQFADGKVPCCVDARGADPVAENDSMGELVFLVHEVFRYTHDRALLDAMWPHVDAAMRYLDRLRQSGRTDAVRASDAALYGLLPASISHEGYSEKPMHSYWDDFWGLKGYDGAITIADTLGHIDRAREWRAQRDEFAHDIAASLSACAATHHVDYLAGAAELGDFDPTSSAIALAPRGDSRAVPPALLRPTFERYWANFTERRDGRKAWDDYTPYELRNVGAFVRLGWRERAHELLAFFMADRRPAAWNQWAEVVGRDARKIRFVGDMPHGWIASDFIRAALDLLAYERDDDALVLAAGVSSDWLGGRGIAVSRLRTPYGALSYSLRESNGALRLRVDRGLRMPPGGLVFAWPHDEPPRETRVNGRRVAWQGRELRIDELPADVVVQLASDGAR